MFVHSNDPRVLAWQAANNILGEAAEIDPESPQYFAHIQLAQVYASLATVPNDVLTGLQLAQFEHNVTVRDLQAQAEQEVSEMLNSDEPAVDSEPVNNGNVIPLR